MLYSLRRVQKKNALQNFTGQLHCHFTRSPHCKSIIYVTRSYMASSCFCPARVFFEAKTFLAFLGLSASLSAACQCPCCPSQSCAPAPCQGLSREWEELHAQIVPFTPVVCTNTNKPTLFPGGSAAEDHPVLPVSHIHVCMQGKLWRMEQPGKMGAGSHL